MTFNNINSAQGNTPRISGLSEIADKYELILCDVWGVLHNGIKPRQDTIQALTKYRQEGGCVIMVTNAPRQRKSVFVQLENMGVPEGVFDTVVTSGDVTRDLMRNAPNKMLHIGPDKDLNLFEGLDAERVTEEQAEVIICTGLYDEQTEKPEDYLELLTRLKQRDLAFICANPDIVVDVGDKTQFCAGAIAREYTQIGGKTLIAGKPHHPIYDLAIQEAEKLSGKDFDRNKILAIGDGMPTDIKGARDYGLDALYISAGIHAGEYGDLENPDYDAVLEFLAKNNASPVAYSPRLVW